MAFFEVIKDIDGKNYLSLENLKHDDRSRIGSKLDDFEILQKLGEGSFGKIYSAVNINNQQKFALKMVNK